MRNCPKPRLSNLFFVSALLATSSSTLAQDVQFGGTRQQGMGGAGLALPIDVVNNNRLNPALLAYGPKGFSVAWPSFGYRLDGLSLNDVTDFVGKLNDGVFDADNLISFGSMFGRQRRDLGVTGSLGVTFEGFAINGIGNGTIATLPNANLQAENYTGARIDAYGLGYYGYGVSYGKDLPAMKSGRLSLGVATKIIRGYYAHKYAEYTGTSTTATVVNAESLGGRDTQSQSGFGADLGLLFTPEPAKSLHFGAVIENLIEPNVKFDRQVANTGGANGTPIIRRDDVDLFRTAFNVGVGADLGKNLVAAFDVIDIGNRAGRSQAAGGLEYLFAGNSALRVGYNSRTSFTVGVSIAGFNIALSGRQPLTVGTGFRF